MARAERGHLERFVTSILHGLEQPPNGLAGNPPSHATNLVGMRGNELPPNSCQRLPVPVHVGRPKGEAQLR